MQGDVITNLSYRCGNFLKSLSLRGCQNVTDTALRYCVIFFCSLGLLKWKTLNDKFNPLPLQPTRDQCQSPTLHCCLRPSDSEGFVYLDTEACAEPVLDHHRALVINIPPRDWKRRTIQTYACTVEAELKSSNFGLFYGMALCAGLKCLAQTHTDSLFPVWCPLVVLNAKH